MPMSSGGHVESSSDCATRPKAQEIGWTGYAGPPPRSSHIGRYVMATAEHREPCDSRGSCTVLGAPGGEIPPGDSTIATGPLPLIGTRGPIWSENRPDSDGKARGTCCSSSVTEPRSMAMQDQMECEPSTTNAGTAEQGKADRSEAATATQARLVDPDEASNRRPRSRPCNVQSGDRQQASWL